METSLAVSYFMRQATRHDRADGGLTLLWYNRCDKRRGLMPVTIQSLGIDRLDREQRIALVLEIWDTIAAEQSDPLLNATQRRELRSRVAEDDAAPNDVVPWEQVKAQALARLKQP